MTNKITLTPGIAAIFSGAAVLSVALIMNPGLLQPNPTATSVNRRLPDVTTPKLSPTAEKEEQVANSEELDEFVESEAKLEPQPEPEASAPEPPVVMPLPENSPENSPEPQPEAVAPAPNVCGPGNPMRQQAIYHRKLADLTYNRDRNLSKALALYQQSQREFRQAKCPDAADQVQWAIDKIQSEMNQPDALVRPKAGVSPDSRELPIERRCVDENPVRAEATMLRVQADVAYDHELDLRKALRLYRAAQRKFESASCNVAVDQLQWAIDKVSAELAQSQQ